MKIVRYIVFTLVLLCISTLHAQTMRLDSIVTNDTQFDRMEKHIFTYDSLNRAVKRISLFRDIRNEWNEEVTLTYKYDMHGRVSSIIGTLSGEVVRQTAIYYDERGNMIKKVTTHGEGDKANVDSCICTYDSADRRTSITQSTLYSNPQRIEYGYNKKGILCMRKEYENIGTRIWNKDKIVDTGNPWKEIIRDVCDREGNIIMHRDYNSGDTIRFVYSNGKLIKSERYTEGRITSKKEHYYDHLGNPISTDNYYEIQDGEKTLEHAYTYTILYNKDIKAKEVSGLEMIFDLDILSLKAFTSGYFGDGPEFLSVPCEIISKFVNYCNFEDKTTIFHYSYIQSQQ